VRIYDTTAAAAAATSADPARPASAVLHDCADARVVVFRIEPGQRVAVHTSSSTVLLTVLAGTGRVSGAEGEQSVRPGDVVAYDVAEPHGMRAGDEQLVLAAVITPRPGTR
jgi:quercetin dioxygenase-like cupin family protein